MIKLLANLALAGLVIAVCWYVLFFWLFPRAIGHYRSVSARRRRYDRQIHEIGKEPDGRT